MENNMNRPRSVGVFKTTFCSKDSRSLQSLEVQLAQTTEKKTRSMKHLFLPGQACHMQKNQRNRLFPRRRPRRRTRRLQKCKCEERFELTHPKWSRAAQPPVAPSRARGECERAAARSAGRGVSTGTESRGGEGEAGAGSHTPNLRL